mgnify:FL=1|tara:strand:- start:4276 stop:4707 length:432 start_codon:yes stop_codon:yes gene_type:complete
MIAALLLIIINVFLLLNTKEPKELTEVRQKYQVLREHLKETNNEEFDMLYDEVPITAHYRISKGAVGYNTNKGNEIGLCIDGDTNEIFHVLLHELAHCTVEEYSHSKEYWEKFKKLRKISVELGIYEEIPKKTKFCNKYVQDK